MTGLFLAALGLDVHVTDTYFVIAHFHYNMVGGTVIAFLGGVHYWWPKISGKLYPEGLSRLNSSTSLHTNYRDRFRAKAAGSGYSHPATERFGREESGEPHRPEADAGTFQKLA
jgi:Cytochrome C and Quinol oxidase polypeptide I